MMSDEHWMLLALDQAHEAAAAGEVPVGAVLVKNGVLIATGRNTPLHSHDPSGHAEINAMRSGATALGNYRLEGCELFVTLEPCAMCAGAMLHARLARVVYGARDPKTGAAGSVVDLFSLQQLNHRTRVTGDVLFDACARVLRTFFHQRRQQARKASRPLRDDALRTPEERFSQLPHQGLQSAWSTGGPIQRGWQMHWIDTSANGKGVPVVCLHGPGQWGYFFRHLMEIKGVRWIAPDLIGFGRSDKPKREAVHDWEWHRDVLLEWLHSLQIGPVLLTYAESAAPLIDLLRVNSSGLIGQHVFELPDERTGRESAAWRAPFPDHGHEAALRALGRVDVTSSGPSHAQALRIAGAIMSHTVYTMGYCRP